LPFENLKRTIKKHVKSMLNNVKYGDENRKPLLYVPTYSVELPIRFKLPEIRTLEPLQTSTLFPSLSREILIELFKAIGVLYVPEITLYYLKEKTPFDIFENFCRTFGEEEDEVIDANRLNRVIMHLQEMDKLRRERLFDSSDIYKALADNDFEKAEELIKRRENNDKNAF